LVDNFNATFHLLEKQRKQHTVLRRTGAPPDFLPFMLAEYEYHDMQTLHKWSGNHTKGSSAFNTSHPSDMDPDTRLNSALIVEATITLNSAHSHVMRIGSTKLWPISRP
jgi:hypothetical protein